jgi:hypothetical protein
VGRVGAHRRCGAGSRLFARRRGVARAGLAVRQEEERRRRRQEEVEVVMEVEDLE